MKRFVQGVDRGWATQFPERLDDRIDENDHVRVIDAFVGELDLAALGFEIEPPALRRGRPEAGLRARLTLAGSIIVVPDGRLLVDVVDEFPPVQALRCREEIGRMRAERGDRLLAVA